MKTKLNLRISLVTLSVMLLSASFAQKNFGNESAYFYSSNQPAKTAFSPSEINVASNNVVSKKVLKRFNRGFKNAENTNWQQLDDAFLVTFVVNNITTKSLFDKKGNLVYSIGYSSEKELPVHIKNMVTNNYTNYAITSVAKILQDSRKIWIIKLACKTNFVAVRIENDNMDEIENFQKTN